MMERNFLLSEDFISGKKALIMGVLNLSRDSFSDGGKFSDGEKAFEQAMKMVGEGADIIDIGAEASGPDSARVETPQQAEVLIPLIRRIRRESEVLISVDTYRADLVRLLIPEQIDLVNDIGAGRFSQGMFEVLAACDLPFVMSYSKDFDANTTRENREYDDVFGEVLSFFQTRIAVAESFGIDRRRMIVDPGLGFFVSGIAKYSMELLGRVRELSEKLALPVIIGASRKSFIGEILGGKPVNERLFGSLACVAQAYLIGGVRIFRVHDVKETSDLLRVFQNHELLR
jgi:dihydropteroate synthase